jgi:VanZ family protein
MITVMGIIFFLSHQPGDTLSLPDVPNIDKVLHAGIYGLLAATILFAVNHRLRHTRPLLTGIMVVFFCMLYGISDEFHQSFIPGRTASLYDLAADTIGAIVTVSFSFRFSLFKFCYSKIRES